MKKLRNFDFKNKKVLVRCDFNVPLSPQGEILDDFRIKETIPTIEYLEKRGARTILISHLGKLEPWRNQEISNFQIPDSKLKEFSLEKVAFRLEKLLKQKIRFLPDCLGEEVEKEIERMKAGEIILLENLRFYKEEKEANENFARKLAKLADIYINDAFATCHRNHASVAGIPKYLPSGLGLLLEREIENLKKITKNPLLPLVAIFGGQKANFRAINKISKLAKSVLIGFLIKNQIEREKVVLKYPQKIIFPVDSLKKEGSDFDIGPETIKIFKKEISQAKTIFWSGPLGKIEEKEFQRGTKEITEAIIKSGAFSVVGGGDTMGFINKIGLAEKFDHLSTGGNAMLVFLAGEKMPGIEALKQ